jgi:hypothetical protein
VAIVGLVAGFTGGGLLSRSTIDPLLRLATVPVIALAREGVRPQADDADVVRPEHRRPGGISASDAMPPTSGAAMRAGVAELRSTT